MEVSVENDRNNNNKTLSRKGYKMLQIVANPKSTTSNFPERYEGRYNGQVTIEDVNYDKKSNCFFVHMTSPSLKKANQDIVDIFGNQKDFTKGKLFAQQVINRASAALKSSGDYDTTVSATGDDKSIDDLKELNANAKREAYKAFMSLIGKTVTISQFQGKGGTRLNYDFNELETNNEVLPGMLDTNKVASLEEQLANIPF
jgi:hypothetical protein